MLQYLLKRVLIFIPTLLVISLLAFGLSKAAPGDPVELKLRGFGPDQQNLANAERIYRETADFLGLNKPVFYVGLSSAAYPDTLYNILRRDHRENLAKLVAQYGNWEQIEAYYHQLLKMNYTLQMASQQQESNAFRSVRSNLQQLFLSYSDARITSLLDEAMTLAVQDSSLQAATYIASYTEISCAHDKSKAASKITSGSISSFGSARKSPKASRTTVRGNLWNRMLLRKALETSGRIKLGATKSMSCLMSAA